MIKRLFFIFCLLGLLTSCGQGGAKKSAASASAEGGSVAGGSVAGVSGSAGVEGLEAEQSQITMEKIANLPEEPIFDIVTTKGVIKVKLYANTPKHRENFAKLAFEKFYDGILFHRVIADFMIQVGDPLTKDPSQVSLYGTGGPGYTIPAEFRPENTHKLGALAAARRGDAGNPYKESSGSQFYIVQSESGCRHLDGQYTVFGETLEGFDVIEAIAAVPTNSRGLPVEDIKIITIKLAE